MPSSEKIMHSSSPASFGSSGSSRKPSTSPQNTDWAKASRLSKVVWEMRDVIVISVEGTSAAVLRTPN